MRKICILIIGTIGRDCLKSDALFRIVQQYHFFLLQPTHNIPLLRDIVEEKQFRSGNITTKYLMETYPEGFGGSPFVNILLFQKWLFFL